MFGLILAVESVVLIPSALQFERNDRQRLALEAQILVQPQLSIARGGGPDLASLIGEYGLRAVAVYGVDGGLVARAGRGELPPSARAESTSAIPVASAVNEGDLLVSWRSMGPDARSVVALIDARGTSQRLEAYVLRVAGLVAIIVLIVTVGTMVAVDLWVLRPVLRLRDSSVKAGADPDHADGFALRTRRGDEMGELIRAHNSMLEQVAASRARDRAMTEERARFLARHDPLTGLPNRAALLEFLEHRREMAGGATLLLVNVVRFRLLNAAHGSQAGDRMLCELARRLQRVAAAGDFVARLGADRFVLARGEPMPLGDTAALAERVIQAAAWPMAASGADTVTPSVRVGIAHAGEGPFAAQDLVTHAELALGRTDDAYGEKYQFYSADLAEEARIRQQLAQDLEQALARKELSIVLQPKLRLEPGAGEQLAGAEVLVRWRHPSQGMVSPATFIPIAEATGLIGPIGDFVLRSACEQIRAWLLSYGGSPRLAVNLSAQQFAQPQLAEHITWVLREYAVPPGLIELEITETAAMRDVERTAAILAELRARGIHVSIDDFGTGYSSLNYLRRFAVDTIKIDKSFVDDIGKDRNAEAICDAILRLGHSLGTRIVAEGVETEDQAAFLRRRKCDEAQGYLFGRPVSAEEFDRTWLASQAAA